MNIEPILFNILQAACVWHYVSNNFLLKKKSNILPDKLSHEVHGELVQFGFTWAVHTQGVLLTSIFVCKNTEKHLNTFYVHASERDRKDLMA